MGPLNSNRFEDELDELQGKLQRRRVNIESISGTSVDDLEPGRTGEGEFRLEGTIKNEFSQFSDPPSPPYSSHLIPAICITPSDPGLVSPFSAHRQNVEFVFEDVLEFWKSFEYVKVGVSCL
jgi:hypothetical protein